jgi:hypothetical protein
MGKQGCELLYLLPYSLERNPIEEAFAKIKGLMRKAEIRIREALIEAMGAAISAVTATGVGGFFNYCGYRLKVNYYDEHRRHIAHSTSQWYRLCLQVEKRAPVVQQQTAI